MLSSIIISKNKGYQWFTNKNCCFKGYLQKQNDSVIREADALLLFSSITTFDEFVAFLKQYYGLFSIIIFKNNEIWLATDVARSMPLYYTSDLAYISDDVDALRSVAKKDYFELDDKRVLEMYATSYVGFQNTVFCGIKQIELGCAARIKAGMLTVVPYFKHYTQVKPVTEKDAISVLHQKTKHMIKRVLSVVGNRQIVISLSGGYDSRYLACSLKENGVENVICYTYGRSDSFEVAQSKRVADALGYKWFNINYDDATIKKILDDDTAYLDYCNRADYSSYLQNYIAVKTLHNENLIPKNSVFLTGLCNDMPTGFYIPDGEMIQKEYSFTNEGVADYNLDGRFVRFDLTAEARGQFKQDILSYLQRMGVQVTDYEEFVSALDCLETSLNHSHCFLNMNTVHEFFGYEWVLPCWDKELLSFWYSLPPELRKGQKLYEEYITQHLANRYGVGTKKHLNKLASAMWKVKVKRKLGGLAVRVLYPLGIPVRRNTDVNNFSVLEVEIYKHIKQKNAVKADRAALILLLTIYMMERRYGHDWYAGLKKYLA